MDKLKLEFEKAVTRRMRDSVRELAKGEIRRSRLISAIDEIKRDFRHESLVKFECQK
ncbi:hypothetical protein P7H15_10975 [Paenibacillus larvae]|nr:hypothetical protein [Paenibacillus larvae]MDT2293259.1 hypothetical protein [Paenibacillus larvae]